MKGKIMQCERCWTDIMEGSQTTLWFSYTDWGYYSVLPPGHEGIQLFFDQTCGEIIQENQLNPYARYSTNFR